MIQLKQCPPRKYKSALAASPKASSGVIRRGRSSNSCCRYFTTIWPRERYIITAAFLIVSLQWLLLEKPTTSQVAASQIINSNINSSSGTNNGSGSIIIEQQSFSGAQLLLPTTNGQHQINVVAESSSSNNNKGGRSADHHQRQYQQHIQPSFVLGTRNRSINFTHLTVDDATDTVYVGATNWLFQLSSLDLHAEYVLKTGPASANSSEYSRDCAPADCSAHIAHVEAGLVPMHHERGDLSLSQQQQSLSSSAQVSASQPIHFRRLQSSLHAANITNNIGSSAFLSAPRSNQHQHQQPQQQQSRSSQQQSQLSQSHNNNYNKILVVDHESRQLIVCGSLNQGACRKHQLGQLANFSELIPLPVASNDEHSTSVALITTSPHSGGASQTNPSSSGSGPGSRSGFTTSNTSNGQNKQPIMYVAATNSKLGPYREMVPAISGRYLEPASKAMQIIEKSFTDSARIDISFELRDYYLVNYIYAFQHNDYVYFATVQRKSPLRQLEEWGYITRLARLCLSDLSFQSYTELTLECRSSVTDSTRAAANSNKATKTTTRQQQQQVFSSSSSSSSSTITNYNLLQDAYLTQASSNLAHQLGVRPQSALLATVFAQSKDHTTKSQQKSAICLFPMEKIEAKFNENIHLCYNGSSKARNMNYIAGSVNDCPKAGRAGNIANFCNEPIKLNGSLPLQAQPVMSFDDELLTSIVATQASTSSLNYQASGPSSSSSASPVDETSGNTQSRQRAQASLAASQILASQQQQHHRQHQVLIVGTSEGSLKRIVLVPGDEYGFGVKGVEFDEVQVDETHQEPILADLHLMPTINPQLRPHHQLRGGQINGGSAGNSEDPETAQFAILATPSRVVKFRVNSCRHPSTTTNGHIINNTTIVDDCNSCAQLQDPFCGWCATSATCSTRESCLNQALAQQQQQHQTTPSVHWQPFDQIKCADYQPVWPRFVALQANSQLPIEVNVRLPQANISNNHKQQVKLNNLTLPLAQAQFTCHFDYISMANRSMIPMMRISGATTKATQARLNLHTSTVVIACPLPPILQRPQNFASTTSAVHHDELQTRLSVRMLGGLFDDEATMNLQQLLGLSNNNNNDQDHHHQRHSKPSSSSSSSSTTAGVINLGSSNEIERQITLYDCSVHSDCKSCLTAGQSHASGVVYNSKARAGAGAGFACSWCPLSNKCTFNASHPEFGCAASAVSSTTPHSVASPAVNAVKASHLTPSLDLAQASVFGISIDRLSQCPASNIESSNSEHLHGVKPEATRPHASSNEILIPHNSRRSIQVQLKHQLSAQQRRMSKLECLIDIEGAKARLAARIVPALNSNTETNQLVVCQESSFVYNEESSTQRAQLLVILNENQVIETIEVILYKCHLFGLSPPALTSTVGGSGSGTYSSVAWRAHELFQVASGGGSAQAQAQAQAQATSTSTSSAGSMVQLGGATQTLLRRHARANSDCSLCLNVERKFQCSWCGNQCLHSDQCSELSASTCPPPRIDSIHPTSGPLEGGTLITIEGSNLGSNEREIQDKISVGGENCQLVMYSVSTRIVCKTNPSTHGPQAATVFVGNRAGVTSAYEKFHYKAVHLTDVNPHIGPVSGGTRLYLTGSNLNIGSRVQIFLDDIPCSLDGNDITNNQITCITAPNLVASSMRITKLTLMIDNSTHYLPYPFTYHPDPIITSIEPAESFVSGGRLILITGQNLDSPQSTKLMVYHDHRPNIINGTSCIPQNSTLITCLTPALSRDMLTSLFNSPPFDIQSIESQQQQQNFNQASLSYESGGLKLKLSLFMDDVRSVRNLDEYYHHLPHYLTYFDDPQLFRLQTPIVDYTNELYISGENLKMKQLDQDLLITIGSHICTLKSITPNQVVCEPPEKISPLYGDSNRSLIDSPILPIIALVGSNLKYHIGHMQYSSSQYQVMLPTQYLDNQANGANSARIEQSTSSSGSTSVAILICLSIIGFTVGFAATFMFVLSKFRHSKAEREYKRIQLQMGSLDNNGQPFSGNLFDNIIIGKSSSLSPAINDQQSGSRSRALDYVGGAFSSKKLFSQLNQHQLPSFPPSPLTDISSLTGSNPSAAALHNQHVVRLSSNGTIINSTTIAANNQQLSYNMNNDANSNSSQSSPSSTRNYGNANTNNNNHLYNNGQNQNSFSHQIHQQQIVQQPSNVSSSATIADKSNLLSHQHPHHQHQSPIMNGNTRNYSWTQEAPSTIVPYAVIEACNLTLEGKNAIKEYV